MKNAKLTLKFTPNTKSVLSYIQDISVGVLKTDIQMTLLFSDNSQDYHIKLGFYQYDTKRNHHKPNQIS